MTKTKTRTNNYELITNKLVTLLERGVKPWTKPWQANSFGNLIGGNKYQGCNPLLCQMDMLYYGYTSPYFISFNQAKEKNWKIKKGSKATTLTYAGSFEIETENGDKETRYHTKFYKVFNLNCVDDSAADIKVADLIQEVAPPVNPDSEITSLEAFCESHNVPIFHGGAT